MIAQAVLWGIPTPAFSTALAFFDGYRSEILPANILQAQRDYFGAHTFRVLPGKENARLKAGENIREYSSPSEHWTTFLTAPFVDVNWTGRGGNVSASSYNA